MKRRNWLIGCFVFLSVALGVGCASGAEPFNPETSPPIDLTPPTSTLVEDKNKQKEPRPAATYHVLFLVDISRDMCEELENRQSKIAVAQGAIKAILKAMPPTTRCSLRTVGGKPTPNLESNQLTESFTTGCRQTTVLVPAGLNNHKSIEKAMQAIVPAGLRPLTYALAMAVKSDINASGQSTAIIIVSSGSDTCSGDPARYAKKIRNDGVLTGPIYVLSLLRSKEPLAAAQMHAFADAGGGQVYDAQMISELAGEISKFGLVPPAIGAVK